MTLDDKVSDTPKGIVDSFAKFFSSVYLSADAPSRNEIFQHEMHCWCG